MGQAMAECAYNFDDVLDAFSGRDYAHVLELALPAAMAGNSAAQCMISFLYQGGCGVPQDFTEAERWLLRAAEQDYALAWNKKALEC
jgi:TPR repeat protein